MLNRIARDDGWALTIMMNNSSRCFIKVIGKGLCLLEAKKEVEVETLMPHFTRNQ